MYSVVLICMKLFDLVFLVGIDIDGCAASTLLPCSLAFCGEIIFASKVLMVHHP